MKKSRPSDVRCVGVGIDTARYGHCVSFLRDDKQRALPPVDISESPTGYRRLQRELGRLQRRYPQAEIYVRIDAAGQYAYNLETFVRSLDLPLIVSVGEPKRNDEKVPTIWVDEQGGDRDPEAGEAAREGALLRLSGERHLNTVGTKQPG